jgi:ABC-type transport system involved in cytochrome bd biosynthesis fused ATPase/permease subunit
MSQTIPDKIEKEFLEKVKHRRRNLIKNADDEYANTWFKNKQDTLIALGNDSYTIKGTENHNVYMYENNKCDSDVKEYIEDCIDILKKEVKESKELKNKH